MDTPTPSVCTCFRVRRASRRLTQLYDHLLAPAGLSLNQYSILRRAEREPRTLGALAEELGMDRTTLTRNLSPLVDGGLLESRRGDDARQRVISITAAGKRTLAAARPRWQQAQAVVDGMLGEAGLARLHDDLDALDARLRDYLETAA